MLGVPLDWALTRLSRLDTRMGRIRMYDLTPDSTKPPMRKS
jgi:hypothetical protein